MNLLLIICNSITSISIDMPASLSIICYLIPAFAILIGSASLILNNVNSNY